MHRQVGGSGWFRGDFNVHTPFSGCYLGQGVTARELLARGHGLDFMVIADHNSFDGYLNLLEHWEPGCPVLFPGVELKAAGGYGGLSFVVVLNPSYSPEELESFLRELNLSGTAKGDHDLVLPLSLPEVARVVRKYDGIVLWSKLDTPEGIFGGIDEGQRRYILSLDWPVMSFDLADSREGALCPGVWSSNAHRSGEIGKTSTMVKMAKLDFQGLKFALQDPQSRVRSGSAPRTIDYPQVISLKVQGGFLDGQEFLFNPGLNCLIGPRGTGKTTLLKLLGFALGKPAEGLEFLLGGGEVEVLLLNTEGEEVFLRRSLGQPPKSFDPWGRPLSFDPRSFGMFLAQGELEKVVLNPEFQLELLDSMWESGDDKAALEELALKLQDNYESMVKLEGEIEELQEQLAGKESLAQRLKELQDMPLGEIQQRLVQRDRELLYLDRLQQIIQQNLRLLKQLPFGQEMGGDSLLWKALEETRFAKDSLSVVWEAAEQELAERRAQAAERHRRLEAEYREFLGGCTDSRLRELLKERERLQSTLVKLEPLEVALEKVQESLNSLKGEREALLKSWTTLGEEIYHKRVQAAASLNAKLEPAIRIHVQHGGNRVSYHNFLAYWLRELGARVIRTLEVKVEPGQLLEMTRQGYNERLAELTGFSLSRCRQIFGILSSTKAVLQLETLQLPDLVQIYLREGAVEKAGHKLSTGQRCTAVLPLLLLAGRSPLVIDQPEDQLDNAYVYTVLVSKLRELKDKQQFIFATHNPNIPVLADAEQNFILESDGKMGRIKAQGYIENPQVKDLIQEIMEGGKDAFMRRAKCYGQMAP